MTTRKTFKRRVRARMAKTGQAYTTARSQLVRKADARAASRRTESAGTTSARETRSIGTELPVSEAALREGSGHGWNHWFRMLDAWGATERSHTEIARWLREDQGVGGWWAQSITGGYERARGIRAKHQFAQGFAVSATRTIDAPIDRLMAAFSTSSTRRRWLPDASLRRRQTTAADTLRFDWAEPPSRITAWFAGKGDTKTTVTVEHSRLPDADSAERYKLFWRARLVELKELARRADSERRTHDGPPDAAGGPLHVQDVARPARLELTAFRSAT